MKKSIIIIIAIFLGITYNSVSQDELKTDNADAVYEKVVHEFILNEDSSTIYNYSQQLRLLTYYSYQRLYGESFVVYNPDFQKLKIRHSETTMADAITKVKSPSNAYNEVLPRFAAHAAPYMHYKEMVITHTGLEKNALIDFGYSIETKKEYFPGVIGKIFLRERSPIKDMEIRVVVPKNREITYFIANGEGEPDVQTTAKWKIYKWNFKNIPLLDQEASQPYWGEHVPTLYVSTASKEDVLNHLKIDNSMLDINAKIKEKVSKLIEKIESKVDITRAISNFVNTEVGLMDCKPVEYGYNIRPAKETYKYNVGSQFDKTVLLKAMLREAGINSHIHLVSTYQSNNEDITLLKQFDDFVLFVPELDMFVSATEAFHQYYPADFQNKQYFNLETGEVNRFAALSSKDNYISFKGELNVEERKVSGKGTFESNGYFRHEFKKSKVGSHASRFFANSFSKVKVDETTLVIEKGNPTKFGLTFTSGDALPKFGELTKLEIPASNYLVNHFHLPLNSAKRNTPLNIKVPYKEDVTYVISYDPAKMKLIAENIPAVSIKNNVGKVTISIEDKNGKITVNRYLELTKNIVQPDEYSDYLKLIKNWKLEKYKTLYFK